LHTKRNFLSIFLIGSICYLFLVTVGGAYGFNIDFLSLSSNRALVLVGVVGLGLLNVLFKGSLSYNKVILWGLVFSIYMFVIGFTTYSKHYDISFFVSCSVFWILIVLVLYNIMLTDEQLEIRAVILTVFLCALSLIYLLGNIFGEEEQSVLSINSIYYVVTAIPFLFLCKNPILQTVAFLLSSGAILMSGKSVCLIIWVFVCIAFYKSITLKTRVASHKTVFTIVFVLLALFFGWNFIRPYLSSNGFGEIFEAFFDELQEGGNGRFDIYGMTIDAFKELPLTAKLVGKGFYAIDHTIHTGTHNDFLMVLYNYGIIGLCLYITFFIQMIKSILISKRMNSPYYTAQIIAFVIFVVLSMASNIMNTQIQFLMLCVFWGFYLPKAANNEQRREGAV